MDFVNSSSVGRRWGSGLRAVGQHLLARLDVISSGHPPHHFQHDASTFSDTPAPCLRQSVPLVKPLPLDRIPEDVSLILLSFLGAGELCAVRRTSRDFLQTADRHAGVLWGRLCRHDFPSMSRGAHERLSPHQQYIKNVMHRAIDELGNLRATSRVRESLEMYNSQSGVVGLVCDLGTIEDPRVARAVSFKRRVAMSTLVVTDEKVVYDFRRRGLFTGPLNFLPLRTLELEHPGVAAGLGGGGAGSLEALLPMAPETPAPPGFLGYAVRLVQLRPEHESLRWTVLFALFKDMVVFEHTWQAESLRARMPDQRLFYCSLDHAGALADPCPIDGPALPHIGHWGFRALLGRERVGDAMERLERTACFARSSLAFLQYGGGVGRCT